MAFNALGVHRALQPWRIAGLRHWLCDSEEAVCALAAPPVYRQAPSPVNRPSPQHVSVRHPRPPAPESGVPAVESGVAPGKGTYEPGAAVPGKGAHGDEPRPFPPAETPPETLDLALWPEAWTALLARSPEHPLVVWTYPAMSDDYGGRSDPVRRAFLQQILADMAMPAGSNAFWPMSPPPYDVRIAPDPVFFHSGLAVLSPSIVVFFGPPPEVLGVPRLLPLVPDMFQGRRLVCVQPVDLLAANLASGDGPKDMPEERMAGRKRHEQLVQFLKSQFQTLFPGR